MTSSAEPSDSTQAEDQYHRGPIRACTAMLGVLQEHATSIHSWLDAFGDEPMTHEASVFMYLLLGADETKATASETACGALSNKVLF